MVPLILGKSQNLKTKQEASRPMRTSQSRCLDVTGHATPVGLGVRDFLMFKVCQGAPDLNPKKSSAFLFSHSATYPYAAPFLFDSLFYFPIYPHSF